MNQSQNTQTVKKGDFIELKYTGFVDGKIFDSNISENLKQLNKLLTVLTEVDSHCLEYSLIITEGV